jgi:hypothetical protein
MAHASKTGIDYTGELDASGSPAKSAAKSHHQIFVSLLTNALKQR